MGKQSWFSKLILGDIEKQLNQFSLTTGANSNLIPISQVIYAHGVSKGRQEFDPTVAVDEGYKMNPPFYAGVNLKVKNLDLVSWFVETQNVSGDWERNDKHELNKILELPDPKRNMSLDDLLKASMILLDITGNYVWYKVRAGANNTGKVVRWQLLPLANLKPIPDLAGYISHYEYKTNHETKNIKPEDIIHGKEFDPHDMNWGLSKLKVLAETVDTDNAAQSWNRHAMNNRGVPDGAWIHEGEIEQEDYDKLYDDLLSQFGGVQNAHKPMLLAGNTKWVPLGLTPQEMDWLNSRKFNAKQIAMVLGIHPALLGDSDAATYNNMDKFIRAMWTDAVIPSLNLIMSTINIDLMKEYPKEKVRVNYSLADVVVLREDYGAKLNDALKMQKLGVPLDEINRLLDLGLSEETLKSILSDKKTDSIE